MHILESMRIKALVKWLIKYHKLAHFIIVSLVLRALAHVHVLLHTRATQCDTRSNHRLGTMEVHICAIMAYGLEHRVTVLGDSSSIPPSGSQLYIFF